MSESKAKLVKHIEVVEARNDELCKLLREANQRHMQVHDACVHLNQVLLVPTEKMLDAARPLMMVVDAKPRNLGVWRDHVRNCGHSIDSWPAWAKEGPAGEHITKAGMAEIIWMVMAAASGRD